MNGRIKERLIESGLYTVANGNAYPAAMSAEESEVALHKFAELLIKDCQGIVDSVRYICSTSDSTFLAVPALRMAESNIGKYFGMTDA